MFEIYILISIIVSIFTILRWSKIEAYMDTVPFGDDEYYSPDYYPSVINIVFLPSLLFCGIWIIFCRIVNFFRR